MYLHCLSLTLCTVNFTEHLNNYSTNESMRIVGDALGTELVHVVLNYSNNIVPGDYHCPSVLHFSTSLCIGIMLLCVVEINKVYM